MIADSTRGQKKSCPTIDLFAGAGGLSLGFERAGFEVVQAVEINPHAATTYKHNHPRTDLIQADIQTLAPEECMDRLKLRPGDVKLLIAGLPCQGFSESNRRTRNLDNPRNHLYKEVLRFLKTIQPAWFTLENVAGLGTMSGGTILKAIVKECHALGYRVVWRELNAMRYGAPQSRRRIFIIGNRLGAIFRFPHYTHGPGRTPCITVREAIGDLPHLENGASVDILPYRPCGEAGQDWAKVPLYGNLVTRNADRIIERYEHIGPGQNWTAIPADLTEGYRDISRCHTGLYYRLEWDKPSKVIGNFRKNMLIHPEQHRGLSVREAARLQTFGDNYVFLGSIGFQQQQVADAVPPVLAEAVAHQIRRAWIPVPGGKALRRRVDLLTDRVSCAYNVNGVPVRRG